MVDDIKRWRHLRNKGSTGISERNAMCGAIEQAYPQLPLELGNRIAQGR